MYVPIYYIIVMLRVQSVRKTISKSIQYIYNIHWDGVMSMIMQPLFQS